MSNYKREVTVVPFDFNLLPRTETCIIDNFEYSNFNLSLPQPLNFKEIPTSVLYTSQVQSQGREIKEDFVINSQKTAINFVSPVETLVLKPKPNNTNKSKSQKCCGLGILAIIFIIILIIIIAIITKTNNVSSTSTSNITTTTTNTFNATSTIATTTKTALAIATTTTTTTTTTTSATNYITGKITNNYLKMLLI